MRIVVTGRSGSGKSTLVKFIEEEATYCRIFEVTLEEFYSRYEEGDKIVVVDTPAMLCQERKDMERLDLKKLKVEGELLNYVTELPNCTIIRNELAIDEFKVRIKKSYNEIF